MLPRKDSMNPSRKFLAAAVLTAGALAATAGSAQAAVNASFSAGVLNVTGDTLDNNIAVSRNAAGGILVNGGAVAISGGTATVANTDLIQVFGLGGNDTLNLVEANGALPRSNLFGGSGNDALTGGSGVLQLSVQNELDQPVNVGVRLDETSSARLSSGDTGVQVVPARNATPIQVRVEPQTSGRFVVQATLVDEEGRAFGEPREA